MAEHDKSKYCDFHTDHGHCTAECSALRYEVIELLGKGHLVDLYFKKGEKELRWSQKINETFSQSTRKTLCKTNGELFNRRIRSHWNPSSFCKKNHWNLSSFCKDTLQILEVQHEHTTESRSPRIIKHCFLLQISFYTLTSIPRCTSYFNYYFERSHETNSHI